MLQRIRERITGWIAGVVIALVAGSFVLLGVEYYFQQNTTGQNIVATVNGEKISQDQVNDVYAQLLRQSMLENNNKPLNTAMKTQLKSMATQSVITNTALLTTLENWGFEVGLSQVEMMVSQTPEFQENGTFSKARFMTLLSQSGLTPTQFFQRIQSQLIIDQAMQGVGNSAFVLPNEIAHIYRLRNQSRAFGYMVVPAKAVAHQITVSPKEIEDYYAANKNQFKTPEKVSVRYIVLSPADIAKTVQVSATQAKAYYESNLMNYQVPARWEVMQVVVPFAKNASASDIAKAKSEAQAKAADWRSGKEPKNAVQTTFSAAQVDDQFQNILQRLQKGQVSDPLPTSTGFSVLKMVQYTAKQTKSFESVEKNIIEMMTRQEVNQVLSQKSSQLADLTYTNPGSLEPAAKALNLSVQTSGLITKAGEKAGIFSNQDVLTAVYSDDVFKDGNNSNPISLPDGSQVVVRVDHKEPSQQLSLSDVSANIKQMLITQKTKAQTGLLAYQLQQALIAGKSPRELAVAHHLQWNTTALTASDAKSLQKLPKGIVTVAYTTPISHLTSQSGKPLGVNTVLLADGDYAVVAITQAQNANPNDLSAKDREELSNVFSSLWGQMLQHFWVSGIVSDSKIKMQG